MTLTENTSSAPIFVPGLKLRASRTRKGWPQNAGLRALRSIIGSFRDFGHARAAFRVDLSDIPLTHRRDRIEVAAAIAMDEDARPDTRLRAFEVYRR